MSEAERAATFADVERVPGVAKPDPILVADGVRRTLRRPRRGRRRPRRGPAGHHHRAHRAQRRRQDDLLQPPHRVRQARRGPLELRRPATSPASRRYKVARQGMVRTFQLTKSLARLSVIENMKARRHRTSGASGSSPACSRPLWRDQEPRDRGPGRRAARPLQARPHARRVRRLPLGRAAQAAGDGPGPHGPAPHRHARRADGRREPGADPVAARAREVAARARA